MLVERLPPFQSAPKGDWMVLRLLRQRPVLKKKPFRMTAPKATEHQEQCAVVDYLRLIGALFFAIPNYRPMKRQYGLYAHLLAEGFTPGVSDLFISEPRGGYHGCYLEMKTDDGEVTDAQFTWIRAAQEKGYAAYIAYGAEQGITICKSYLAL